MAGTRGTHQKKAAILAALELHPSKSRACRAARVPRKTLYNWCAADADFKAAVAVAQELGIDAVEDALFQVAMKDDTTAKIFTLKSWRRDRYGDKRAVDVNLSGSLVVTIAERPDGPQ